MKYDKEKLKEIIERLETIKEYGYITYPSKDELRVKQILNTIEESILKWEKMQNDNYSY